VSEADEKRQPDFVDRALQSFDHVLDIVHDKFLRPLLIAGRAAAFGFIVLLAVLVLVCVLVIAVVRLLNVYLFAGHEWLSYTIIGAAFLSTGLLIWRRRRPVNLRKQ
jgi:LPXTG-motif cell wall-anchored protein